MAPRRAQSRRRAPMPTGGRPALCSVVLGGSAHLTAATVLVYGVRMSVVVVVLGRQVGSVALVESVSRQTRLSVLVASRLLYESVLVMILLLFSKYWRKMS